MHEKPPQPWCPRHVRDEAIFMWGLNSSNFQEHNQLTITRLQATWKQRQKREQTRDRIGEAGTWSQGRSHGEGNLANNVAWYL